MQHHGSILYSKKIPVEAERMLRYMERSTIYYLKQKGWNNVQIAEFTGHHRDTVARVLREEVDKKPKTRERTSAVAVFDAQIVEWLDQNLSVIRMLEARTCQHRASLRWERHRLLRLCAQTTPCPQTGTWQSGPAV